MDGAAGAGDNQLPFLLEQAGAKWLCPLNSGQSVFSMSAMENLKRAAILKGVCLKTVLCTGSVLKGKLAFLTN